MSTDPHLVAQLDALSEAQRAELAYYLLRSLTVQEDDNTSEWEHEIGKRIDEIQSGAVTLKPAEELLAELERRYP